MSLFDQIKVTVPVSEIHRTHTDLKANNAECRDVILLFKNNETCTIIGSDAIEFCDYMGTTLETENGITYVRFTDDFIAPAMETICGKHKKYIAIVEPHS